MKHYIVYYPTQIKALVRANDSTEAEKIVESYLDDPYTYGDEPQLVFYIDLRYWDESVLELANVSEQFKKGQTC